MEQVSLGLILYLILGLIENLIPNLISHSLFGQPSRDSSLPTRMREGS